jgi:hypothetical protein
LDAAAATATVKFEPAPPAKPAVRISNFFKRAEKPDPDPPADEQVPQTDSTAAPETAYVLTLESPMDTNLCSWLDQIRTYEAQAASAGKIKPHTRKIIYINIEESDKRPYFLG